MPDGTGGPCKSLPGADDFIPPPIAAVADPDVGVYGFEIGVAGFSRSSIFLADGVLALLLVPLLGECGAMSFFVTVWTPAVPIDDTADETLSRPFSRGDVTPFITGLGGPSLASSTTRSWSLFSPSLCAEVKMIDDRARNLSSFK